MSGRPGAEHRARFWAGKRVVLTGHTGFKGSWMALWLRRLGAHVTGISLPPATSPALFTEAGVGEQCDSLFCDIRDRDALAHHLRAARPEIVVHLAAQSLVLPGYHAPVDTFAANVMGTVHCLDALRDLSSVRVAVMVTTDKVYAQRGAARPFVESDPLGGYDPYSASKAACELVIASYRDAFLSAQGVAVASARAGNVVGGGDWAADRLMPDAIRAWRAGGVLAVRQPDAVRPWQHVLDPLDGYLTLAEALWDNAALAGAYNFGPAASAEVTVRALVDLAREAFGGGDVDYDASASVHEAERLSLDPTKSGELLGVRARLPFDAAVRRTVAWYRAFYDGRDARRLCAEDIDAYEALA